MQALARALSTESDILILDDVFSALDRRTRWRVAKMLLKGPLIETKRTIIYTTHDGRIIFRLDDDDADEVSRTNCQPGGRGISD